MVVGSSPITRYDARPGARAAGVRRASRPRPGATEARVLHGELLARPRPAQDAPFGAFPSRGTGFAFEVRSARIHPGNLDPRTVLTRYLANDGSAGAEHAIDLFA